MKAETTMTETITVNGKLRPLGGESIEDIVASLGIDPARRGVAVAVNAEVVPRAGWSRTRIKAGDKVEVVRPLAGG